MSAWGVSFWKVQRYDRCEPLKLAPSLGSCCDLA
jgi:hypothetical protein